jgi:hypothetical protein
MKQKLYSIINGRGNDLGACWGWRFFFPLECRFWIIADVQSADGYRWTDRQHATKHMDILERETTEAESAWMNAGFVECSAGGSG